MLQQTGALSMADMESVGMNNGAVQKMQHLFIQHGVVLNVAVQVCNRMILSCEQNDSEDKRCNQQFEEWTDRDGFGCDFYSGKSHLKSHFKIQKIEFTAVQATCRAALLCVAKTKTAIC